MIPRRRTAVALTLAGLASGAVGSGVGISVGQDAPTTPADPGTSTTPPPEPTPPPPATTEVTPPPPAPAPTPAAPPAATPAPTVSRGGSDAPTVAPVAPQRPSGRHVRPSRQDGSISTPSPQGGAQTTTGSRDAKKKKDKASRDGATTRAVPSAPTPATPGYAVSLPGAVPIGVPNFFIDRFRIPPFLLPIYQAAGIQYGVRWEILAAINEIETDYGRNLNVSNAGAVGWMQFMPSTWKRWGVDANKDGVTDPYNPVDAIFSAARYLRAAGADTDIRKAIFAYNHANWYVDSVLMRARLVAGLPADLVGSLTGLTEGRFPVHSRATYADAITRTALRRAGRTGHAAVAVMSQAGRRGIDIYADAGAPVIAVQDGKVVATGKDGRRGLWVKLRDLYGNSYTYEHLGSVVKRFPAPKADVEHDARVRAAAKRHRAAAQHRLARTARASATSGPTPVDATDAAGRRLAAHASRPGALHVGGAAGAVPAPAPAPGPVAHSVQAVEAAARQAAAEVVARRAVSPAAGDLQADGKQRIFAHPTRANSLHAGGVHQLGIREGEYTPYMRRLLGLPRSQVVMRPLRRGATIVAGTVLGRVGAGSRRNPSHMRFTIRPAGRGAPLIDPKPILDGWKLLESTAIYRAAGVNALGTSDESIGRVFLQSKNVLAARVLNDSHINIYPCGRSDIRNGLIDRRVLATLEFLRLSGLDPTVSALECGHGYYTSSGNVSEHSSGNAVDIAAINGIPIVGHQGPGSITDITIRRLLTLQGTMKPHQIISLMTFDGADNTLALPDHYDHIHVGFAPEPGTVTATGGLSSTQWSTLMGRLSEIPNPLVPSAVSESAIPAHATAHTSRRATRTSTRHAHAAHRSARTHHTRAHHGR